MPQPAGQLSENSRRLAKNTLLLYFRMFLLLLIGLLWLIPYMSASEVGFYEDLKAEQGEEAVTP